MSSAVRTNNPVVACVAGMAAQEAGRMQEAVEHFELALSLAPALLDVRLLLAFASGANGNQERARIVLNEIRDVLSLSPTEMRRVADAAVQLGATAVALTVVRKLAEANPADADLQSTFGALLHRTGAMDEAGHVLNRAVLRSPSHVPTLMNSAQLLVADGNYAGALRNYDRALKAAPKHHKARWYRGLLHLTMGNFVAGWTDHEARRQLDIHTVKRPVGVPAWDGRNASGKTLLLWGEQGLGDQIQGVRFAQTLTALGARVIVRCASPLRALFEGAPGVSQVVTEHDETPQCDAHVPMLSVPYLLRMFDDAKFDGGSYLAPSRMRNTSVKTALHRRRVGVAWAGSPGHTNDHLRSLPAPHLASLLDPTSLQWVSLQVGARASEIHRPELGLRGRIDDASPTLTGFLDTAAIVQALDCVVTVDTSVAHLAGALGVPTLLLVPFVPDWRWQLVREDSPWYSSVRLIRQPSPGDWSSVVSRVHRELAAGGQARAA